MSKLIDSYALNLYVLYMSLLESITPPQYPVIESIAYATADNFTGAPVYRRAATYLHSDAAACLVQAIMYAEQLDLRLKVFDAFRPSEAQYKLWEHTPDPDFLAHPDRGSPHSRGVAIDLTLTDRYGNDLDMGTAFDAFTPLSYHGVTEISTAAQRNRLMLLGIMTSAGFDFYRNEWWHYQLFNSRDYPVLTDEMAGTAMM